MISYNYKWVEASFLLIHIRAVIPHFFAEEANTASGIQIGSGFGSRSPGARMTRNIALTRCLLGLLNLRRSRKDLCLNLIHASGEDTPETSLYVDSPDISVEIVLVVHDDQFLLESIQPLVPQVKVLKLIYRIPAILVWKRVIG